MSKLFSDRNRPIHIGRFPTVKLKRKQRCPDLSGLPPWLMLDFLRPAGSANIVPAMAEFHAMMDAVRDGGAHPVISDIPANLKERSNHLKAFAYFNDIAIAAFFVRTNIS